MQKTDDCFPWCFSASFAVTFAGSHETHENGPLRPRQLPVGSLPVSDGWWPCGAFWCGLADEPPPIPYCGEITTHFQTAPAGGARGDPPVHRGEGAKTAPGSSLKRHKRKNRAVRVVETIAVLVV